MSLLKNLAVNTFGLEWLEDRSGFFRLKDMKTDEIEDAVAFYIDEKGLQSDLSYHPKYTLEKILYGAYEIVEMEKISIIEKLKTVSHEKIEKFMMQFIKNRCAFCYAYKSCRKCDGQIAKSLYMPTQSMYSDCIEPINPNYEEDESCEEDNEE